VNLSWNEIEAKVLDKVVKAAYGGKSFATEAERVADLMERYQALVTQK